MVAKQFTASKDKGSDIRATKTTKVMVSAEETTKTKTAMKRTDVLSDAEIERVGDLGSMIAEEMNALSLKEREDVYEQVHGVDPPVDETKEFVSKCLMALDKEIKEIPVKPAYDQAIGENREYVEDPKLRLAFLRAESYNAKRAAIRFVKFMDGKLEYFGPECLTRRIHLSDLDEDAVAVIKSGCMQLLPDRDRAGRAVVCDMHPVIPNAHKQGIDLVSISIVPLFEYFSCSILCVHFCGSENRSYFCHSHKTPLPCFVVLIVVSLVAGCFLFSSFRSR